MLLLLLLLLLLVLLRSLLAQGLGHERVIEDTTVTQSWRRRVRVFYPPFNFPPRFWGPNLLNAVGDT